MAQRSDAPLIRHLTQTYGPETAQDWQRPPLVVMPSDGFAAYVEDRLDSLLENAPDPIPVVWSEMVCDLRGAFSEAVRLHFSDADEWQPEGKCWLRIRVITPKMRKTYKQGSPWLQLPPPPEGGEVYNGAPGWFAFECFFELPNGHITWHPLMGMMSFFAAGRDLAAIAGDAPDEALSQNAKSARTDGASANRSTNAAMFLLTCSAPGCRICSADKESYQQYAQEAGFLSMGVLCYLTQCNEHLVEVAPKARKPLPPNQLKVQEAKPWLRETLPHYILLDPMRVQEYGHPSAQRAPVGHHAPPRPHTRRGHWAVLQHERFARNEDGTPRRVWVKQAWVGATEWDYLDQRYRVVLPKVAQKAG